MSPDSLAHVEAAVLKTIVLAVTESVNVVRMKKCMTRDLIFRRVREIFVTDFQRLLAMKRTLPHLAGEILTFLVLMRSDFGVFLDSCIDY